MVTSVGNVGVLVGLIRSQLAPRAHGKSTPARAKAASTSKRDTTLASLVETRVRAIRGDDPQRGRKAFRAFLEVVLLAELGENLLAEPRFFQLLDDVQAALENNESSRALVDQAIMQLLAAGDGNDG